MMIECLDTAESRTELQKFFASLIPDIEYNAVPDVEHDDVYAPLALAIRDGGSGEIVAALLSCHTQFVATALMTDARGLPFKDPDAVRLGGRHSLLDLMATAPEARKRGLATKLLEHAETELASRGVRAWYGCVDDESHADELRAFYERRGFRVLPDGAPLPPLLGTDRWNDEVTPPVFWFYKSIRSIGGSSAR
ncbi:GNAT family N-acetyltransferase [Prescottella equi]|uniref:GNAT family N-acetyltransferase n=1 Tax=Rhodococcus hoagii TaxID=43767 RepID=UPI0007CD5D27|nr:GNAT family N-acetyltransferase [Prescottella equi]